MRRKILIETNSNASAFIKIVCEGHISPLITIIIPKQSMMQKNLGNLKSILEVRKDWYSHNSYGFPLFGYLCFLSFSLSVWTPQRRESNSGSLNFICLLNYGCVVSLYNQKQHVVNELIYCNVDRFAQYYNPYFISISNDLINIPNA